MSLLVKDVVENVRRLLQDTDEGGIRWIDTELVGWLNEGAAEIVRVAPESSARNVDMQLLSGTRQRIPSDGTQLLDVIRNVGADDVPGRSIRIVNRRVMDNERPDWHFETPASVFKRYMFEENDPMTFYVYPPSDGTTKLTIVYAAAPQRVAELSDEIPIRDIYFAAITNYVCFRAWQKQLDDNDAQNKAMVFKQLFDQAMGERKVVEAEASPNGRV